MKKHRPPATWTPPEPQARNGPIPSFDVTKPDEDCTPSEMDAKVHRAASVRDYPELWTAVAEFSGEYHPNRWQNIETLVTFLSAGAFAHVSDHRTWISEIHQSYPDTPLGPGRTRGSVPEAPARAFYLVAALSKLLAIVDAPPQVTADLARLLSHWMPKRSEQRLKIQLELYRKPDASLQEIAERVGCSKGKVSRDLAAGRVIRPLPR